MDDESEMKWWRKALKSVGNWLAIKNKDEWLKDMKGNLSLVATVITTMTFQTATNPPGGVMPANETGDLQCRPNKPSVASFGTKGNIKLLHDFDRPFSGEAGVKMISNLTFKQENTIADEPVVDLLKYLTNKLDAAVVKARLPSGHNSLQQLVLIIADGRFHEKENLKRCVRDVSTGNRMVAFLLLDNSQESIMDLKEASFEGGKTKFSKYMDSFPFPYYIVLRNIEALPRTLANLLRQWMELMHHATG